VAARKRDKLENRLEEKGWFELSDDYWRQPGEVRAKLRLLADTNIPRGLVEALRSDGISVTTSQELNIAQVDDSELYGCAQRENRVLLTNDADFWSDRSFPVGRGRGIIFLDSSRLTLNKDVGITLGFTWAKSFGGGWKGVKLRITSDKCYLKGPSHLGKTVYEMAAFGGRLFVREVAEER
jgi:predicted nuclease of predicted toxin-antitoxin system